MQKEIAITLLIGGMLAAAPAVYGAEHGTMSDTQHRKTMSGLHHPEHSEDVNKQVSDKGDATMSDAQHRKHMSGLHHNKQGDDGKNGEH